ncbi:ribosomal protein S6 kinase-related protein isoform X2 [Pangasianodon hypophthalmus]|uniref:ribosomal protein S6 kinase-related protein isoform X2 n=1 Tax=Pangasianodon hypophthalmus TaxID=310915 RepID=UPI000EFFB187|nr:ribosomal protein S6 kinase-related protein isoform X2 [Pangasianodon hypophthalmus]
MGGAVSKNKTPFSLVEKRSLSSKQRFLSPHDVLVQSSPLRQQSDQCTSSQFNKCTKSQETNPLPSSTSIFLPEFPHREGRPAHLQVTGVIAKGSFGPILKVNDSAKGKTYAIKVLPKSEVLRHGALEQSKEEVIIQRQLKHAFVLGLEDCWQSQNNLFVMCDYCSTGDLYTYWMLTGQFKEREVRVFAAELGSALGFLHDFGIMHRDLKMENILLTDQGHVCLGDFGLSRRLERGEKAFTICGTIQYMAPEVLTGGPYSHAADWWSLGILLYTLAEGEFPLPPESDHSGMLTKVTEHSYEMPLSFSPALALLLTEVLMKSPILPILELKDHPNRPEISKRGLTFDQLQDFECDLFDPPSSSTDLSPAIPHQH